MNRLDDLYQQRRVIEVEIATLEGRLPRTPGETPFNSKRFLAAAADLYGVTVGDILSETRNKNVASARQAACWLLRADGWSLPMIGKVLGRDHTTVLYACRKIDADAAVRALLWPLLDGRAA